MRKNFDELRVLFLLLAFLWLKQVHSNPFDRHNRIHCDKCELILASPVGQMNEAPFLSNERLVARISRNGLTFQQWHGQFSLLLIDYSIKVWFGFKWGAILKFQLSVVFKIHVRQRHLVIEFRKQALTSSGSLDFATITGNLQNPSYLELLLNGLEILN